jgi:AAA+ superfamily predicted ATPase
MDLDQWPSKNGEFLNTALEWLRYKLMYAAGGLPVAIQTELASETVRHVEATVTVAPRRRRWFQSSAPEGVVIMPEASPAPAPRILPTKTITAEDVREKEDAMNSAAAIEPPPALMILQRRFGLDDFERNVVLLSAAMELDTGMSGLYANAHGYADCSYPTFTLAFKLWPEGPWSALAPDSNLRYWRLIEINQPGSTPLVAAALRADEKIVNYLKGFNHVDERLEPLLERADEGPGNLPGSHQAIVEDIIAHVKAAAPIQQPPIFQLIGPDAAGKRSIAKAVCDALGIQLYSVSLGALPSQPAELESLSRLLGRETILVPRALFIDAQDAELPGPPLRRFLTRARGLIFCAVGDRQPDVGRETIMRDVAKPPSREQLETWTAVLGDRGGDAPALLAGQFRLNASEIHAIATQELANPNPGQASLSDRLWDASLAQTRPRLDVLAQRIQPSVKLEDVVLPREQSETLKLIADHVRTRARVYDDWGFRAQLNRGLGISALFAGDTGTGKTMAAEALAAELKLNLYRIDLSAVVNKYIGETEKNLRRLFDAAEDGGAILFFDECDALFGKRSEVKDSHDRYANIEIDFLLQRLEAFTGLAILATNMKSALDSAFTRRLRFIVTFPFPGAKEREVIWRKVFPRETPAADLDYARLAALNLSGANIQSIAMNAAFLAAQAGEDEVSMRRVVDAARAEFRKFDWPINEGDFQ